MAVPKRHVLQWGGGLEVFLKIRESLFPYLGCISVGNLDRLCPLSGSKARVVQKRELSF